MELYAVADVARKMYEIKTLAQSLSLSSNNLQVAAFRLNKEQSGLVELAKFFAQFSRTTAQLADEALKLAIHLSKHESEQLSVDEFDKRLQRALAQNSDDENIHKVIDAIRQSNAQHNSKELLDTRSTVNKLKVALEEISTQMTAVLVIAVNAKIEVPAAGNERSGLADLSSRVDAQASTIKQLSEQARKALRL